MQETGDLGLIPAGSERCHGGGNGNALQYSSLKNPMDRGAWQATVHRGRKESNTAGHENIYIDINIYDYRLDR